MLIPTPYKIAAAIAAFVTFTGGVSWLSYDWGWGDRDAAATKAELAETKEAFAGFIADYQGIRAAAGEHQGDVANLARRFNALSKDLKDAIAASPLPDSCPPIDAGRMSVLRRAVEEANSAARGQPRPAVP